MSRGPTAAHGMQPAQKRKPPAIKDLVLLLFPRTGMDPLRPQPPLSLLALAPIIEAKGLVPLVVDQRVEPDCAARIRRLLPRALFVGVTSMTGEQLGHALELIGFIKAASPQTPVVLGGIHASLTPEQTAAAPGVDLVAIGEGETVLPEIIDHYLHNTSQEKIASICYKKNGKILRTPGRELLALDRLPIPAWHLIDPARYTDFTVQCGRGCPHACTFCYNKTFNARRWRARRPEAIAGELAFLYEKFGITDFHFIDDNFFTDFDRVTRLCGLIVEKNLSIRWKSSFRADYFRKLTPELAALLKKSGLALLFVGGESGSPAVLERIKKGVLVEDILAAARISREYELPTSISFMAGFPFETDEDRRLTFDLMDAVKKECPSISLEGINLYTPYPGTELFEESKEHGLREPESTAEWAGFVFNRSNLPWLAPAEGRRLMNISFIARFVFWERAIRERFLKRRYYPFYWFLRASARLRWKKRWFAPAPEWDLFRAMSRRL